MTKINRVVFLLILLVSGRQEAMPASPPVLNYPPLQVSQEKTGWTAAGSADDSSYPYFYDDRVGIRPVPGDSVLFVMEDFENREKNAGMKFVRDYQRLTALRLSDGKTIFSTYLFFNENPFIPRSLFAWKDRAVVYGYYQEKPAEFPENDTRICYVYVFNESGELILKQPTSKPIYEGSPVGIDSVSDRMISLDYNNQEKPNYILIYQLPTGELVSKQDVGLWVWINDVTVDQKGNLYLIRRESFAKKGIIEKYSLSPWRQLWSRTITPEYGFPLYLNFEVNLLWYGIDYMPDDHPPGEYQNLWDGGPLDSETGQPISSAYRFNPQRIQCISDGNLYQIESIGKKRFRVQNKTKYSGVS